MICRLLIALALGAACALRAPAAVPRPAHPLPSAPAGGPVDITADKESFDGATGDSILSGHARLTNGELLLTADEIRYNANTATATAVGHVAFTRSELRLLADRLVYKRSDDSFSAENIRLGSYPYFIEGFSASGTRNEITVLRARASYGEPGPWQPTINADKIIFAPGQALRTENVSVGIGHAQPVPIPRFEHKLGAPLVGAVNLTGGYRSSLGVFADGTVHVPITPSLRLGADAGIFTSRGVMFGPSGRYGDPDNPDELHGYFRSGYINDHGDKKTDILGRPIPEDRAFAEWQHQQILAPNLTLNAQLNWWKDSDVLRDFRPREFFPVQEPDTFVESVYAGPNYLVSAFARFRPNTFHHVQERLPEVRFDLLPFAVGQGFYQRFNASLAVLRGEAPLAPTTPLLAAFTTTNPLPAGFTPSALLQPSPGISVPATSPVGSASTTVTAQTQNGTVSSAAVASPVIPYGAKLRTDRLDAYYALTRPFAPTDWLAFTPVAGGRLTHYFNTNIDGASRSNYERLLGELGADLEMRTSGTFDYKNPQWKIDGLRHLMTPRLSYRYIPEADKGQGYIPPIDHEVFSTYLQPLGLGDGRNVDDLHATNTLRLGLDNLLQTRDPVHGSRDLIVLNVANDFRFKRRAGERDVSEIQAELAVMPAQWLQFDLYQSFAPQDFSLHELNSGVTLKDGRWWSLRFGNNFLRNELQDYSLDARARINERFDALTRLRYDERRHRFNEQAYGIVQNLGNTWLISYTVSLYSGRRRESSFGFNVQIDTVRF